MDQGIASFPSLLFQGFFGGFFLIQGHPKIPFQPRLGVGRTSTDPVPSGIGIKSQKSAPEGEFQTLPVFFPTFFHELGISRFGMRFPGFGAFPQHHGSFWIRFHLWKPEIPPPERGKIREKSSWIGKNGAELPKGVRAQHPRRDFGIKTTGITPGFVGKTLGIGAAPRKKQRFQRDSNEIPDPRGSKVTFFPLQKKKKPPGQSPSTTLEFSSRAEHEEPREFS